MPQHQTIYSEIFGSNTILLCTAKKANVIKSLKATYNTNVIIVLYVAFNEVILVLQYFYF